jgi:hypothetical protein
MDFLLITSLEKCHLTTTLPWSPRIYRRGKNVSILPKVDNGIATRRELKKISEFGFRLCYCWVGNIKIHVFSPDIYFCIIKRFD